MLPTMAPKADRQEQQRLVMLDDREADEDASDHDHR
jgi:hypothetical protein